MTFKWLLTSIDCLTSLQMQCWCCNSSYLKSGSALVLKQLICCILCDTSLLKNLLSSLAITSKMNLDIHDSTSTYKLLEKNTRNIKQTKNILLGVTLIAFMIILVLLIGQLYNSYWSTEIAKNLSYEVIAKSSDKNTRSNVTSMEI